MTAEDTDKLAMWLLRQYRDIPSLDKSRDYLAKRYGEADFLVVRARMAELWLRQQKGLPLIDPPKPSAVKKEAAKQGRKKNKAAQKSAPKRAIKTKTRKEPQAQPVKYKAGPKGPSPKVPPQYVPNVIASTVDDDKRFIIDGVSVGPKTPAKDIAHLLLLAYGSPAAVKRLSMYLSKKVTRTRFEQALPVVEELYAADKEFYDERFAQKKRQRAENRARNRELKEAKLREEKEKKTVAEQNRLWQQKLEKKKRRGSENYFKLIYIPMGGKQRR